LIAADTSVVVAAFATWHQQHEAANRALTDQTRLVAHCALEVYSVLTRLPAPHRTAPELARDFLAARFPRPYLILGAPAYRSLIGRLVDAEITGGSAYDALVGTTASAFGATLMSCDRRAATTYERLGVRFRLLAA
jgi:predicted nucleic acid-binding protein